MPRNMLYTTLAIGLLASPAMATVTVDFYEQDTVVPLNHTFWINIEAEIDASTPIIGWGLDILVDDPTIAAPTGNLDFSVGPWDAVYAADGDDLAGALLGGGLTGHQVLVAVEFQSFGVPGVTGISLCDDNPTDLTEGFPVVGPPVGLFADVEYVPGSITVPEPASLSMLALAVLLQRRRRV